MMPIYDVAIVGSGFTGSLLAYVLASRGLRIALIDATPHPRFAVGESSTPVADLLLEKIARDYGLTPLLPLARYGSWKQTRPDLVCGKKRGFSYFLHHPHAQFQETSAHEQSLMVTASVDDTRADTQWLRADVDHYFFQLAVDAGATAVRGTVPDAQHDGRHWTVQVQDSPDAATTALACEFLVDASGGDRRLQTALGIQNLSDRLLTDSQSTFGHFVGVGSWNQWLHQHALPIHDHPFNCDDSAQHHLLSKGWLWMLRMDDGRTSVGWTRPRQQPPDSAAQSDSASDHLIELGLENYPSLREIMRDARLVAPAGGLRKTARLQRLASKIAGPNFALMPTAAAVIDPLHSSGIAHGLSGVLRISRILLQTSSGADRTAALAHYERQVYQEVRLMDRLVAGCYLAMPWLDLFTAHATAYFVAAIRYEEMLAAGADKAALWCSEDQNLTSVVDESYERIRRYVGSGTPTPGDIDQHVAWMRNAIAPWNTAGLLDPSAAHIYRYTAAPK